MRRKQEDQLIELAFGELDAADAARLEAQTELDAEAQRVLQTYRDVRGGLRAMAEVPPHQISNERLRDALLAQGLQNRPVAQSGPRWWWMPVATGALAFVLLWNRGIGGPEAGAPVVIGPSSVSVASNDAPLGEDAFVVPAPPPAAASSVAQKSVAKPPVQRAVRRSRIDRPPNRTRTEPAFTVAMKQPERFEAPPVQPEASADTLATDQGPTVEPIVLIAQETDLGTGAQVATEVESASNVLVGG